MCHRVGRFAVVVACLTLMLGVGLAGADETCNSPYIAKLIKGQEDYVYVWTLGVEGLGDGSDKLVTIDVNPKSKTYGKVMGSVAVGTRGEAHHMGFTDDRRFIWAGGLADSKIYVFDIATDPAKPKLVKTIADLADKTGYLGPHTYYALPGRMLVQALSNTKDKGGVTGMAVYNNKGEFIASLCDADRQRRRRLRLRPGGQPEEERPAHLELHRLHELHAAARRAHQGRGGDEALRQHDGGVGPEGDEAEEGLQRARRAAGDPLVAQARRQLGGHRRRADLEALARQAGRAGEWQAKEVATIGDPAKIPLPVDISITRDGKGLWVNTFMDGKTRYFDLTQPGGAEADLREGHRQAGQHDLAELGRQARLHHLLAARQLGQGRRATTSSSCAASTGTARSSSRSSRSTSPRRSWAAPTT